MNLGFSITYPDKKWMGRRAGTLTDFEVKIETGVKIHTLRDDAAQRWKPGRKIHFCTGIRTKFVRCFKMGECKSVQHVALTYTQLSHDAQAKISIHVGTETRNSLEIRQLSRLEIDEFARNDGFENAIAFFDWFRKGKPSFRGTFRLIHWTDKTY